jgi:hypothetical protein
MQGLNKFVQKMRTTTILSLLIVLLGCSNKQSEQTTNEVSLTAISAEFPLYLGEIDLSDKSKEIHLSDNVSSRIDMTIKNFADEIDSLSPYSYMDLYINTICLQNESNTVYLVLLESFPMVGWAIGVTLFYDNRKEEFIEGSFYLGLSELYHYHDNKFNPIDLRITSPEIELTDFDMDGINDYKFTELIYNRTYDAIETIILTTKNATIDTLYFDKKSLFR